MLLFLGMGVNRAHFGGLNWLTFWTLLLLKKNIFVATIKLSIVDDGESTQNIWQNSISIALPSKEENCIILLPTLAFILP